MITIQSILRRHHQRHRPRRHITAIKRRQIHRLNIIHRMPRNPPVLHRQEQEGAKRVFESIQADAGFNAGQSDVWEEVASLHKKFGVRSATYAMADIYDHHRGNLDAFISGFAISDGQTGFVALINGRVTGLEALSRPDAFRHAWPKLIKSYALDAIDMRMTGGEDSSFPPLEKGGKGGFGSPDSIATWLSTISPLDLSIHKSPGLGDDLRWDEGCTVGFILDYQDEAIHTAVFEVGNR